MSTRLFVYKYAPRDCETGGSLGFSEGIQDVRWHGWGQRQATGTGFLIDGLGFRYPARITAYDLIATEHFYESQENLSWYRWLHVIAAGGDRGGGFRGPFNLRIDVEPVE